MKNFKSASGQQLLFGVLVVAFLWVVLTHLSEIEKLANTLAQGQWQWVWGAAGLQIVHYSVQTFIYQAAFYTVDIERRWIDLLPLTFASLFVNSTAPTGGTAGYALFLDDARRQGYSVARATAATILVIVADYGIFVILLTIGLLLVILRNEFTFLEGASSLAMYSLVGGLLAVLLLGAWRPLFLRRLLEWIQRTGNQIGSWVKRPSFFPHDWAEKNANDFTAAAEAIATHPERLGRTLFYALISHTINISSLACLFIAFHQTIHLDVLFIAYTMTLLFWIASPTPNGIGIVETLLPIIYASLNVPAEKATIINLGFRGITFWIPLLVGFFLLRRLKMFGGSERSLARMGQVRLVAILTGLMGLVNVLSVMTPDLVSGLQILTRFSPVVIQEGGRLTAVLTGFALILLSHGLWERKRVAWILTLFVLIVSILAHFLKGFNYQEVILSSALALYLLSLQAYFHALSDRPAVQQGLRVLLTSLTFTLAYGTIGFYLLDQQYNVSFSLLDALRQTIIMFTVFYNPGLEPSTLYGRYFIFSIYIVGATTMAYSLYLLLRPVLNWSIASAADRQRAQAIIQQHGRTALAHFALFPDKAYYFSPGGSLIAYAVTGRVALALGDPIGPPDDIPAAIEGFLAYGRSQNWEIAFYQTLPDYLSAYQAADFQAICIGHEGIINLTQFQLSPHNRQAISHLTSLGQRTEIHHPPFPASLMRQLSLLSDEWLTMLNGEERRFSQGWFYEQYVSQHPVIAIHTATDEITAFANILPTFQEKQLTIDLLRRLPSAEHGTLEFLFADLFIWAQGEGYTSFNLGLTPISLAHENGDNENPMVGRAMSYIYQKVNQFYYFNRQLTFKEKFNPTWEPRYLIFPRPTALPDIWSALLRLNNDDNLIATTLRTWWLRFKGV